jgi:hypothetical protein
MLLMCISICFSVKKYRLRKLILEHYPAMYTGLVDI